MPLWATIGPLLLGGILHLSNLAKGQTHVFLNCEKDFYIRDKKLVMLVAPLTVMFRKVQDTETVALKIIVNIVEAAVTLTLSKNPLII